MNLHRFRAFALLVELRELAELAATLELLEPPEIVDDGFAERHARRIRRVVEPALRVFEELEAVESERASGTSTIADECFVARLGLSESLRLLDGVESTTDGWDVLARANQTIGTLVKSAVNLEHQLCRSFELDPRLSRLGDVERAVALRNAYRRLLSTVAGEREPSDAEVPERLRQARRALDALLEQAIPTGMRIADRREAVLLRRRIDRWFDERPDVGPQDGRRIWQDLTGFAELLLRINQRQELIAHDRDAVARALERIDALPTDAEERVSVPQDLARLYGRDPDLDALLERPEPVPVSEIRRCLQALERSLSPDEASTALDELLDGSSEPRGGVTEPANP